MTALNYFISPDYVVITTDTLSTLNDKTGPKNFSTKLYPIPHLEGVICGTGSVNLILNWFFYVQIMVVAEDISYLTKIAPQKLDELSHDYVEMPLTTIRHFGFEKNGKSSGCIFRRSYAVGPLSPEGRGRMVTAESGLIMAHEKIDLSGGVVEDMCK